MTGSPRFKDFLWMFVMDFRRTWFEALSGGFSVPFVAAGIAVPFFVEDKTTAVAAAAVFLVMGFAGAWYAAFAVWRTQKQRADDAEDQLRPKFALSFEKSSLGIAQALVRDQFVSTRGIEYANERLAHYIRIRIDNVSNTNIQGASAYIIGLSSKPSGAADFSEEIVSQAVKIADRIELKPGIPYRIDFLSVDEKANRLAPTANVEWPLLLESAFDSPGTFRFTFAINAEGKTETIVVEVGWTGEWDTITGREIRD